MPTLFEEEVEISLESVGESEVENLGEFNCVGCKGGKKISEEHFLWQVKQGLGDYTSLEVIEIYEKYK